MRMRLPVISALLSCLLTHSVQAQVTVDLKALQALPDHPSGPVTKPGRTQSSAAGQTAGQTATGTPTAPKARSTNPSTGAVAAPATNSDAAAPASASTPPPALPQTTPATAAIPAIEPAPKTEPQPAPPISGQAGTTAAATRAGLRVTFAAGQSDLSPDSAATIKAFVEAAPNSDATTFNILAYAAGAKDDPSSARRLSLARAMAARAALVADGVASARIFVRALGSQFGTGPADRVDIEIMGDNAGGSR